MRLFIEGANRLVGQHLIRIINESREFTPITTSRKTEQF